MTDSPMHPPAPGLAQRLWPEPWHLQPLRVAPPGTETYMPGIALVDANRCVIAVFYGAAALRLAEETGAAISAARGLREASAAVLARIPAWENGQQLMEHEQALVDLRARLDRVQGLILLEGPGSPMPEAPSP